MIPLRITLKGFLCYREERSITLDPTSSLWMLSGHNGSGKSTIFDAVTFALFGHHRGGGRGAGELINSQSDGLVVEFVFRLGAENYRIRRTARRTPSGSISSTQQIYQDDGTGTWVGVPNTTNLRDGFQPWINEKIGLNYETFTSSVLLLQGQAEKLLSSKPEERRQVLASIVDLARYEVLHDRAVSKRKEADARVDALRDRMTALPGVTDEQIESVLLRIEQATQLKFTASERLERSLELVRKSQEWKKLECELTDARNRVEAANLLLSDAPKIERDAGRLRELNVVLPQINTIMQEQGKADQANKSRVQLEKDRQRLDGEVETKSRRREELVGQRQREQIAIALAEQERQTVQTELRGTTEQMSRLRQVESQETQLSGLEKQLAELPANVESQLSTARLDLEQLERIVRMLPLLQRLHQQREELADAVLAEGQASETCEQVKIQGKKLNEEIEALKPLTEEAERQAERAREAVTRAETLHAQARDDLNELDGLGDSSRCRHCGQQLSENHRVEERKRRQVEINRTDEELKTAKRNEKAASLLRNNRREMLASLEEKRTGARELFSEARTRYKQSVEAVARLRQELAGLFPQIEPPFAGQIGSAPIADWSATTFPTSDDLARFQTQASQASGIRQRIRTLETQMRAQVGLQGQIANMIATIAPVKAKLPADRGKLRQKHVELETREQELGRTLDARRKESQKLETQQEKLDRELLMFRQDLGQIQTKLREQELNEQHARETVERIRAILPPTWRDQVMALRLNAWHTWETERRKLMEDATEQRELSLRDARANLAILLQQREKLETQAADYSSECRQEPRLLEATVTTARRDLQECDTGVAQARQQQTLLQERVRERQTVTEELTIAEGNQAESESLAKLLGRDRLQLHLVRQAERRVVEYANVVLDRLSGGLLYLQLQAETGDAAATRALDLVCINRQTDDRPINVAFLSGSQRFRVAVSLALGIGQYASRQHRPLECVIIDEGFGCLDRQGRQVMIQELQNLRNCLRCILLVSHQEEFADAFPNGYHFELRDGTTEVTRVQR